MVCGCCDEWCVVVCCVVKVMSGVSCVVCVDGGKWCVCRVWWRWCVVVCCVVEVMSVMSLCVLWLRCVVIEVSCVL